MPGMSPVDHEECVKQGYRSWLGLKAQITFVPTFIARTISIRTCRRAIRSSTRALLWARAKFCRSGGTGSGRSRSEFSRLHLEQDAGKSLHDQHPTMSFVDLNRSGVALMEIVSKPDMRSSDEARAYVTKSRTILRYLGTCDGNMEEGSLRADVNVSVRKPARHWVRAARSRMSIPSASSARPSNTRRAGRSACLEDGGKIVQETRLFDPGKGETRSMRSKEEAHDYRYFPDPDLLPLEFDQAYVEQLRPHLPELPDDKKARFVRDFGLSPYDADRARRRAGDRRFFRNRRQGPRRQNRRQLGDQRTLRPVEQRRQSTSKSSPFRQRSSARSSN